MGQLGGKVAIVTGGASGIGRACAERFAQEGARVVVADVQEAASKQIADAIDGIFVKTDVTDPASVEALVQQAVNQYGRLDVLMNNAGIDGEQAPLAESTIENWRKVLSINLDGVFFGLKYGIAAMLKQGVGGVVLNTASTAGMVGFGGIPPYTASKAAVINMTRAAAIEYAPQHIRVNAICPSVVMTPLVEHFIQSSTDPEAMRKTFENMNPLPGAPKPSDIAAAALFLVSDEAAFITGVALPIDGGYTAQ